MAAQVSVGGEGDLGYSDISYEFSGTRNLDSSMLSADTESSPLSLKSLWGIESSNPSQVYEGKEYFVDDGLFGEDTFFKEFNPMLMRNCSYTFLVGTSTSIAHFGDSGELET